MNLIVAPSRALQGTVSLPGDKSISHRAIICGSLASGVSKFHNFLDAGVTRVLLNAMLQLGVRYTIENKVLLINSPGYKAFTPPYEPINCGNSATSMRLLAGLLAGLGIPSVLDGSEGLRRRPMSRIVQPLNLMGADIKANNGKAPLIIPHRTEKLIGIQYQTPVPSAQVKSAIMLAALFAKSGTELIESPMTRNHTELMLGNMGASIKDDVHTGEHSQEFHRIIVTPLAGKTITPIEMSIPGDFSSAAFLIGAAIITPNSLVTIRNVGLNPTRTGLLDVLIDMGANINITYSSPSNGEPVGDITVRYSPNLGGTRVTKELVPRMIDEFPIFSLIATQADGETIITGAKELRYKETDRIATIADVLIQLGAKITPHEDGLTIKGRTELKGKNITSHADHRIGLMLATAGLISKTPITVMHAEIINESFPQYPEILRQIGGKVEYEK